MLLQFLDFERLDSRAAQNSEHQKKLSSEHSLYFDVLPAFDKLGLDKG